MNIKLKTSYDDYNKIAYYTTFEVLDEWDARSFKNEILEDIARGNIKVSEIDLDIEEKRQIQTTHKFYKIEDEIYDTVRNVAVPMYINIRIEKYPAIINIVLETFEGEESLSVEVNRDFDAEDYLDEIMDNFGYLQDDFIEQIKTTLGVFRHDF